MFNQKFKTEIADLKATLAQQNAMIDGIQANLAMIEFSPQGEILGTNALFNQVMGFEEHELIGKHHRVLCPAEYANSSAYQQFWRDLQQAKNQHGVVVRLDKQGQIKHLEATHVLPNSAARPISQSGENCLGCHRCRFNSPQSTKHY